MYVRNHTKPRYSIFCDVNQAFTTFQNLPGTRKLNLRELLIKLAILLLTVTGHMTQTIVSLSHEIMVEGEKKSPCSRLGDTLSSLSLFVYGA